MHGVSANEGLPGLALHDPQSPQYVHPSKWCITREDLDLFEQDVRSQWLKGKIPDNADFPNPKHDDPRFGPTMYQVNEYYIKPKTRQAGGMSWALKQHPEGLQCDVFATHAWIEGVFEFCRKVRSIWPTDAHHLYVCFLANPQNGDIAALLQGSVSDSPFAKALDTAKYVLVVPNSRLSIYLRLWCVYEAWIAVQAVQKRGLEIKIPAVIAPEVVVERSTPGVVLLSGGVLFGFFLAGPVFGNLVGPLLWLLGSFIFVSAISWVVRKVAEARLRVSQYTNWEIYTAYWELSVLGLASGIACWHLQGYAKKGSEYDITEDLHDDTVVGRRMTFQRGQGLAICFFIASLVFYQLHKIFMTISLAIRRREERKLRFNTVGDAQCACDLDKARIQEAVGGHEDKIDDTIHTLRKVGRFDRSVQYNLNHGMSTGLAREGINYFKIGVTITAWLFWYVTDLSAHGHDLKAWVMVFGVLLVAMLTVHSLGERSIFALEAAFWGGIIFLATSNNGFFFHKEVMKAKAMSFSTAALQAVCFVGMLVADAAFYSGFWLVVLAKCTSAESDAERKVGAPKSRLLKHTKSLDIESDSSASEDLERALVAQKITDSAAMVNEKVQEVVKRGLSYETDVLIQGSAPSYGAAPPTSSDTVNEVVRDRAFRSTSVS